MEDFNLSVYDEIAMLEKDIQTYDKNSCEGLEYVRTFVVGSKYGHVMTDGFLYWLCLSDGDTIKRMASDGFVLGFKRESMEEIEFLVADTFNMGDETGQVRKKGVVEPLLSGDPWIYRVENVHLINANSGYVFPICLPKTTLQHFFQFNTWHFNKLLKFGESYAGWSRYAPRLDGRSWEEYVGTKPKLVHTETNKLWSNHAMDRHEVFYKYYTLQKSNASLTAASIDEVVAITGISRSVVIEFFKFGCVHQLGGWGVSFAEDQSLIQF